MPPRCPNADCPRHLDPQPGFFRRRGYYYPACRPHGVPRFVCRSCGRGFSRQTFRADYRDHRPDLNGYLFLLLTAGLGLRQTSRYLGLSLQCTQMKFRKIARQVRNLNQNLRGPLAPGSRLQFDELETFEERRNTRPLTLPVLIETGSRFVIWTESAPIRPRGTMTEARKRAIAHDEARFGRRVDRSERAIRNTLSKGAELVRDLKAVVLDTDEKSSYPRLATEAFGADRIVHRKTNSKLPRQTWNPLFPINHTEAMARDLVSRLRRESWPRLLTSQDSRRRRPRWSRAIASVWLIGKSGLNVPRARVLGVLSWIARSPNTSRRSFG